jgi:2-C-methyl-D-erythritol 4-phosphate cytidylyltransferase
MPSGAAGVPPGAPDPSAHRPVLAAVVVAAGHGRRLGGPHPKALAEVAGRPLVWHAVSTLSHAVPDGYLLAQVVVVGPAEHTGVLADLLVDAPGDPVVVAGGPTRQASVSAGLRALDAAVELVLVHDAARPFVTAEVVERLLAALAHGDAGAVPGLGVHDTIKQVDAEGLVTATLERGALRAIQTPQAFLAPLLVSAHGQAASRGVVDAVDDALLMETAGHRVRVVAGHEDTFKITLPGDLARAAAVASRRERP